MDIRATDDPYWRSTIPLMAGSEPRPEILLREIRTIHESYQLTLDRFSEIPDIGDVILVPEQHALGEVLGYLRDPKDGPQTVTIVIGTYPRKSPPSWTVLLGWFAAGCPTQGAGQRFLGNLN